MCVIVAPSCAMQTTLSSFAQYTLHCEFKMLQAHGHEGFTAQKLHGHKETRDQVDMTHCAMAQMAQTPFHVQLQRSADVSDGKGAIRLLAYDAM